MQRASPASSRCSGVQASSAGIGEPPLSLVAAPSRSTETAYENDLARIGTAGTYTRAMVLALLGVTGYTGRLVLAEARRAGLEVRLVGRRREALRSSPAPGEERPRRRRPRRGRAARRVPGRVGGRVLRRAVPRARPRARRGRASARERTTSTRPASRRSSASCTSGSTSADRRAARVRLRLRARRPGGAARGRAGRRAARRGRRRVLGQGRRHEPRHTAHDRRGHGPGAGRLGGRSPRADSRFGATTRTVRFPFGERTVVEWSGTEPLTVPRHTDVRNVRSYIRAPAVAAQAGAARPA